jgi:hypothetical protein
MSSIFLFSVGSHQRRGKIAVFALARASAGFLDPEFTPPAGLISPSTSVHAFGSWNREQFQLLTPSADSSDALLRRLTCNKRWNETNTKCSWQLFSGESVFGGRHPAGAVSKQNAPRAHEVRFFVNGNRRPCRQPFTYQSVRTWQRLRLAPLPQWQV